MKKQIIIIVTIVMLLVGGISGCNEKEEVNQIENDGETSFDRCALLFSSRQTINSTSVVLNGFDRCTLSAVNKFKIVFSRYVCVWCIPIVCSRNVNGRCTKKCQLLRGPTIIFEKDSINKILTVTEIYPEDRAFYWPELSVTSGSAELPYNIIEIGDMITNCEGHLKLEYPQMGIIIWEGDFN